MTRVSELMTRGVRTLSPSDTVALAAQAMDELDIGAIPVCDGQRLLGMVTDRDIVLRVVAQTRPLDTALSEVMSKDVKWCSENDNVETVMDEMAGYQVRRMPVVDRGRRLVGMLSLGDTAAKGDIGKAGDTLNIISQPAEPDRSGQSAASGPAGGGSS
ncbi:MULTISPECIES: CBS domain-containing protein [Variovorax]|jgi:CBS domain-containing protein|uniref:CBS domain-containing protein n=2 Tax=Variovorax TaxID=34072 RepID=A0AAW8EQ37_VARPD|nr:MULTISPECIES: CBS domain-containing protein [Variovorax]MDP9974967.1 CBS domain-containing protein [Variovorax paradoxus]RSZ40018.1 CBS domain-containing protein [Variovorax beijingensis]WPH16202.1 CBS domain-containing protein [Variovorax paradoxus]WPH22542.1 CBS domain-containing protein [Variovorax paradoxus]